MGRVKPYVVLVPFSCHSNASGGCQLCGNVIITKKVLLLPKEARRVCRQAKLHVNAAIILPFVGLARSKARPIQRWARENMQYGVVICVAEM